MKNYWDALTKPEQNALAKKVGSSSGYLRLVFNGYKKAGFALAQRLEEETAGVVTKSQLRPDIYGDVKPEIAAP
ncbi:YdaS family helix-turn-helix protein [Rahnella inusitata]|uniref:YdaS family helix-turn-helix protein n=1 Tax=Rahnella inusitata TaxID=58169 RepID=UPI00142DB478|nr:YdaS family helix-turn-helix protein [Rahnella inusitata]